MQNFTIPNTINKDNNNFDFLRLIAALLVFFGHSVLITQTGILTLTQGLAIGAFGVNIFFIISGFLITKSWIDSNSGIIFLKKRILRIYPALIFAILFVIFIIGPFTTFFTFNTYFHTAATFEYLNNIFLIKLINLSTNTLPGVFVLNKFPLVVNASLWTIPIEMGCYFLVILFGLIKIFKKRIFFLLAFALLLLYSTALTLNKDFQSYFQTYFQFPYLDIIRLITYFFSGIVLYLYKEYLSIPKNYFYLLLSLLVVSVGFGYFELLSYFLLPILVIFITFLKIDFPKKITQYGDFSYGFYLFAFPIQQTVAYLFNGNASFLQQIVFSFFPTLFLAIFSWYVIEKPFLSLKNFQIFKSVSGYLYKKLKML
jgi:peptidoglycan/LPS O-acetylase OafA/YrhL